MLCFATATHKADKYKEFIFEMARTAISLMRMSEETGKFQRCCGAFPTGSGEMCDYSLNNVKSRPAKVGEKLSLEGGG